MAVLQGPLLNLPAFEPAVRGGGQATTPLKLLENTALSLATRVPTGVRAGARQVFLAAPGKKSASCTPCLTTSTCARLTLANALKFAACCETAQSLPCAWPSLA